jgi:hypothetical protein
MGLLLPVIEALIREKARKPYTGKAYTLGQQSVITTPKQTLALFAKLDVTPEISDIRELRIDTATTAARHDPDWQGKIKDIDLFRMLGLNETQAIDISDFEGAKIVHDLNYPIPSELENSCGLLIDGSLLDNVFDTTTALKNVARLLQPGGRCILENLGNTRDGYGGIPYTMFNPFWFFDYFVWNDFDYCQVYVAIDADRNPTPPVYAISLEHAARHWGGGFTKPITSEHTILVTVYAEKGSVSTWDKMPTQHVYRNEADWARYCAIVERYLDQRRPYLQRGVAGEVPRSIPEGWMRVYPDGTHRYTGLPE